METLRSFFFFETIKLVTVQSVKFGLLFRTLQLLVLVYIVVYSIVLQKGYREFSNVNGVLYTKVKGTAFVNTSTGPLVFDSNDLVVPPMEANAIFITTAIQATQQFRGVCLSTQTCTSDAQCAAGVTNVGKLLPTCNVTAGFCLIEGWCPLENDTSTKLQMIGLGNMTIFMRSSVEYILFKLIKADPENPVAGRNLFYLRDMIGSAQPTDCYDGCIISANINWDCDIDTDPCSPKITFTHLPGKFNYRLSQYSISKTDRTIAKLYGIRILSQFSGRGVRFSFFTLIITIGSGVGFFTLATLIVDTLLYLVFRNDPDYILAKWVKVKIQEQEAGV